MFISVEVYQPWGRDSVKYDRPSPSKSAARSLSGQHFRLTISNRKLTIIRVAVVTVSVFYIVMEVRSTDQLA